VVMEAWLEMTSSLRYQFLFLWWSVSVDRCRNWTLIWKNEHCSFSLYLISLHDHRFT
jgi:hypothetical protein